jgi:anti-sigma factor RsiW
MGAIRDAWWRCRAQPFRMRMRRKRALRCQELVELVTAYQDGALDAATRARFDKHLAQCTGCPAYVEQLRVTAATVGAIRDEQLDPVFRVRLLDAFGEMAGS